MRTNLRPGASPEDVYGDSVCRWEGVTIIPALLSHLREEAIRGLLAIPKRGVEIGGLLLGHVQQDSSAEGLEISSSVGVPCEYSFGPSYILDDTDRTSLVEILERHQREEYPNVVGFYRSYTGREARLDDTDKELLRTYFSGYRSFACLLLRPISRDTCTADVQMWRGGEFFEKQIEPQTIGSSRIHTPTEPVQDIAEATPACAPEMPHGRRRREPVPAVIHRSRVLLLPSLLLLLTAIAAGAFYQYWNAAREPRWPEVRFDAQPSADTLLLSWDAAVPAAARATRGTLLVNEGGTRREIPLGQDQLRRGSFAYSRPAGNVLFQLRLYDRYEPVAQESLRVIQPATPVAAAPAAPAVPPPAEAPTTIAAKPPAVRQEIQPVISPGIRARILSRTVVPVLVSVNSSGRVTKASAKIAGGGMERYLAGEAVKAARRWSFWPARAKDGSPVAGTATISIEFTPAAH